MKKVFFTLTGCFLTLLVSAQDQFLIYSVKGNITVIENKVESKAKVGKLMQDNAQVRLAADAKLTLICNESNLITLSRPGLFSMKDLQDQCATSQSNLSANYVRYVWTQLTQKPGTPEKNRKQFMKNVGAVSRSINSIWIDPRLDTLNYASGNFPLTWKSYSEAEDFEFHLFDHANATTPVTTIATRNKHIDVSDIKNHLKPGTTYYWTAAVKGESNNEKKVLNVLDKSAVTKFLNEIQQTDITEGEAEKTFRMAFLLEQAHFLSEAYEHYQKAASLKPGLDLYKTTLESFRKDYGISR